MPSGRIGLIDYGQIKSLKQAQRKSMARMIIALADGKKEVPVAGNCLSLATSSVTFGGTFSQIKTRSVPPSSPVGGDRPIREDGVPLQAHGCRRYQRSRYALLRQG